MDITRSAAQRYRGTQRLITGLRLKIGEANKYANNVRWDADAKHISIDASWVMHSDLTTHHNYRMTLTLEDVSSLIAILGHAGSASDAKKLRDHLAKEIPALIKLLACASGIVPTPMTEEKPKE